MRRTARRLVAMGTILAAAAGAGLLIVGRPPMERWRGGDGVSPAADAMAARFIHLWGDPHRLDDQVAQLAAINPEWDFMGRTYLVLALANMALRDPGREAELLDVMDAVIDDTLRREEAGGQETFLLDYATWSDFVDPSGRSVFVDGEMALMIGARRLVRDDRPELAAEGGARVERMARQMAAGPVLSAESYPDECWTFCNTTALAAMRVDGVLGGPDRGALLGAWVDTARRELVDPGTGLLVSSYTVDGAVLDGPEGSTIWMAAHNLLLVDPDFARDQYLRARAELVRSVAGLGFAREWPATWPGPTDIDSGPIVPLVRASPASSGLALLGAAAFDDDATLRRLVASLRLAGVPVRRDGELRFAASNHVGDAVMLYAFVEGPLWERVDALAQNVSRHASRGGERPAAGSVSPARRTP